MLVTIDDGLFPSKMAVWSKTTNKQLSGNDELSNMRLDMGGMSDDKTTPCAGNEDDIPLLVSDHGEISDDEEANSSEEESAEGNGPETSTTEECNVAPTETENNEAGSRDGVPELNAEQFNKERRQVMTIIVKYISAKILNSFPPEEPVSAGGELPLDVFLQNLTTRLRLSLPMFMKGVIYLFRYMDIIYLLRYLNQSNNYGTYNDMGFSLRKLIVGCFKLALSGRRENRDWQTLTGVPTDEIHQVVKIIVTRMNGRLAIKNIELVKLRLEIFRYVKMVTKTV